MVFIDDSYNANARTPETTQLHSAKTLLRMKAERTHVVSKSQSKERQLGPDVVKHGRWREGIRSLKTQLPAVQSGLHSSLF